MPINHITVGFDRRLQDVLDLLIRELHTHFVYLGSCHISYNARLNETNMFYDFVIKIAQVYFGPG